MVLIYHNGQVKNGYGTVERLDEANEGHPCENITMTNDRAMKLAQDADARANGPGNNFQTHQKNVLICYYI